MQNGGRTMKFIVDSMLGRLARWLRLFGYDAVYFQTGPDSELIFESIRQKRILLTSDRKISKDKPLKLVLIKSELLADQIEQVKSELGISIDESNMFTRCLECNTPLKEIEKNAVNGKVPEFIFKTHHSFFYCDNCRKVYWHGSHVELAKRRAGL
jgi:hypothetical protein